MIPGCVVREAKTVRSRSEVSDCMTQTGSTEEELAHKKAKPPMSWHSLAFGESRRW